MRKADRLEPAPAQRHSLDDHKSSLLHWYLISPDQELLSRRSVQLPVAQLCTRQPDEGFQRLCHIISLIHFNLLPHPQERPANFTRCHNSSKKALGQSRGCRSASGSFWNRSCAILTARKSPRTTCAA